LAWRAVQQDVQQLAGQPDRETEESRPRAQRRVDDVGGADGGIFNFSALPFAGSLGTHPPASPMVAVAALPV